MVRPRKFDSDDVLTGVMHTFRRQGYSASSVRDLEEASGATSGSLYNTFGSKQGLFRAACTHYLQTIVDQRIRTYAPKGSGIDGLRALFLSTLEEPDGCLITNSAIEFGDTNVPEVVTEGFAALKTAFSNCLDSNKADVDTLLAFYQGILVLVRAGYDKRALKQMISKHFNSLT